MIHVHSLTYFRFAICEFVRFEICDFLFVPLCDFVFLNVSLEF